MRDGRLPVYSFRPTEFPPRPGTLTPVSLALQVTDDFDPSTNPARLLSFTGSSWRTTGTITSNAGTYFIEVPDTEPPSVPEPTALLLLGTGLAAVGYRRRRQQN